MKHLTNCKKLFLLVGLMLGISFSLTTRAADITTATSGAWSQASTWTGGIVPGPGDNIFIQAGHTLTIDVATATVTDLHLSTTGVLAIGGNVLQVSGKIRAYTGAAPGTSSSSPATTSITTSGSGKLQFIGATRSITISGEWGANTRNYTLEFALTAGATGTLSTAFKAGDMIVASGIIVANSDLRCDFNAAGTGTLTVKSGATLRMASNANIQRVLTASATSHIASLTVESGATLEYTGATVGVIGALAISFNGLVYYSNGGAQTLVSRGGNSVGADPNTYTDLTLQAAAKTLSGNTTVNGILSMRANAATPSLVLGGFTLTYGPLATLQYRGASTAAQTTADAEWPSSGSVPPNIDIFNPNTVTLHASRTVSGNLKISGTGSKLILGANNITAGSVTISGTDDGTKYIVTDGTGALTILNVGATAVKFPVGPSAGLYHPATITNTGTADDFSVRVSSAAPLCAPNNSVLATWDITEATPLGSNCTLSLDYTGAATNGTYSAILAKPIHCNGTTADYGNGSVTGNIATGSGFTSFSPFGITSDVTILPVKLTYFTAEKAGNQSLLSWETATENNTAGFEILRSFDGRNFSAIGYISAKGAGKYTFTDWLPAKGQNLYRLKIKDHDGKAIYSEARLLRFDAAGSLQVFPTIATDKLKIIYNSNEPVVFSIINQAGVSVVTGKLPLTKEIPVAHLANGTYVLVAGSQTIRFIKQ